MVYSLFISVTFIFSLAGYLLYTNKHFASGTILLLFGLGLFFCLLNAGIHDCLSFETSRLIEDWLRYIWPLTSLALIVKAFRDNARHEKEEARRREEERKKPIVVNIKITSTTVEKN
ncbi:MAG: hypothetical protein EGQ20_20220 [Bacteroides oleiciplenus]|nr:hypothetical protein [Bacteroides oleiciplenus]